MLKLSFFKRNYILETRIHKSAYIKLYFPRPTLRTPALLLEAVLTFGAFFAPVLSTFFTVLFPKNLLDICSIFNNVNTAVW